MIDQKHPQTGPPPILEILRVRCSAATVRRAEESLRELLTTPGRHAIRLVRNAETPHDLGLHLRAEAEPSRPIRASVLGLRIAASLRDFGPVSHSVWIEIDQTPNQLENPS